MNKVLEMLQPLRIPPGWRIDINNLYELEPTEENIDWFGGSSQFSAVNEQRRFWIDIEWRPEFDPKGEFCMTVLYAPWERTERGRRRNDVPLHFGPDAEEVHRFVTRSQRELVGELQAWLFKCALWQKEGH